jgi:head-tail adaptor
MSWPALDPGELIHQITILRQQASSDISGATVIYVPFVQAYSKIEPLKGTDAFRSGQLTTQLPLIISLNWQAGILPNMRVLRNVTGAHYEIQAVENLLELNVTLVLTCLGLGANN